LLEEPGEGPRSDRDVQKEAGDRAADWFVLANQIAVFRNSNFSFFRIAGDKSGEGSAYGNIAAALINLSRYQEAIEYEQKHLEIAQQAGRN
jgi:hypothetical protein